MQIAITCFSFKKFQGERMEELRHNLQEAHRGGKEGRKERVLEGRNFKVSREKGREKSVGSEANG